jgi:hypothetical protein
VGVQVGGGVEWTNDESKMRGQQEMTGDIVEHVDGEGGIADHAGSIQLCVAILAPWVAR